MAQYRWLQDGVVNGVYYYAGDVASTADVGGSLPANFVVPPACVDPQDNAAIQAFWNQGPQQCGLIRQQWATRFVAPPAIYWTPFNLALTQYQLTGAGAALGPKCAGVVLGNNP